MLYTREEFDTMPGRRGKKRESWVKDFKKGRGCSICGYNRHHSALEFHHTTDKQDGGVGQLKNAPTWRLIKEIFSCILVCSNCHRELHFGAYR